MIRRAGVTAGQTVLVHAAAGGVGAFAVQIARSLGARVIGTASARNHEYLDGIGAEPVEYGDGLVEAVRALAPDGVDVILDFGSDDLVATSRALLADGGTVASIVDAAARDELGGHYVWVRPSIEDLDALTALIESGTVKVEVAEVFDLAERQRQPTRRARPATPAARSSSASPDPCRSAPARCGRKRNYAPTSALRRLQPSRVRT